MFGEHAPVAPVVHVFAVATSSTPRVTPTGALSLYSVKPAPGTGLGGIASSTLLIVIVDGARLSVRISDTDVLFWSSTTFRSATALWAGGTVVSTTQYPCSCRFTNDGAQSPVTAFVAHVRPVDVSSNPRRPPVGALSL